MLKKGYMRIILGFFCFVLSLQVSLHSQNIDARLFKAINKHHSPGWDRFYEFQSRSVKPVYIATPLSFVATGLLRKDTYMRDAGILMTTSAVANLAITYSMKAAINRERPYKALNNVHTVGSTERSASFPSGHTSSAFNIATSLSLAYPKWYVIVPSYAWAGVVGYSRIKMGMHYPGDVLAGALIGAGTSYLTFKLQKPILNTIHKLF
ncbi:MAG TPA: phosphatase PAP2 family protein [bacterium]|nr:phosphatase PAP2 family protein [bacterium]